MPSNSSMNSASETAPCGDMARVIEVTYDSSTGSLEIAEPELDLRAGETLVWEFVDLPSGWSPMVRFVTDGRQGLGPFAALRQTEDRVWGEGNSGVAGQHTYQAELSLDEDPAQSIASDPADVFNQGTALSTPTIWVTVNIADREFDVDPERCACFPGDTITFRFRDLPEEYVPSIHFLEYRPCGESEGRESPHFGPFESFCHEQDTIVAAGSSGLVGTFTYRIFLYHLVDGQWQSIKLERSEDPVIDSEEDPVGTTPEES